MESTLLVQAALGILVLVVTLCTAAVLRSRRHHRRLRAMGARHGLGLVSGAPHARAVELARRYASRPRRVKLQDVLRGDDDDGAFYFARRRLPRVDHHCLFCEIGGGTHVEGFHVKPIPPREKRRGKRDHDDWSFDLRWTVPRSAWTESRSLGVGARVLGAVARTCDVVDAVPMGVEIHHRNLIVHALRPLEGAQLDRFVDDAISLRRQVLAALRAVEDRSERSGAIARLRPRPRPLAMDEDVEVVVLREGA